MSKLNILVLHRLRNPDVAPAFLVHHVHALQINFPEHNYLYHDISLPLPAYVKEAEFDAILLDVSFLCIRWFEGDLFESIKKDYDFVRYSPAVKIAFPQDEYDCNVLLDQWMCDWNVDVVYSVISGNWDVLYPQYSTRGTIRLGYTGYIDERLLDKGSKPFQERTIDIGYRTRKLPPYFGRIGENKWRIGIDVAARAKAAGLDVDIEVGNKATILGDKWFDFIENSKFTLGANSGSSLLDPTGRIQKKVKAYLAERPNATFDEVEAACFPGLEGQHSFTAISPRVLEAALLRSGQILVDGEYSGVIVPHEHYVPIRPDASNFEEVRDAMADFSAMRRMIERCREAILSVDALRYRNRSKEILAQLEDLLTKKGIFTNQERIREIIEKYKSEMPRKYARKWRSDSIKKHFSDLLEPYPALHNAARSIYTSFLAR